MNANLSEITTMKKKKSTHCRGLHGDARGSKRQSRARENARVREVQAESARGDHTVYRPAQHDETAPMPIAPALPELERCHVPPGQLGAQTLQ